MQTIEIHKVVAARALMGRYETMTGRERKQFYNANKDALYDANKLLQAEARIPKILPVARCSVPGVKHLSTRDEHRAIAEELLSIADPIERGIFFRANKEAIHAARYMMQREAGK